MKQFNFETVKTEFDCYIDRVEMMALNYFHKEFKPWLIKHNLRFVSGMGTWSVWTMSDIPVDLEGIPKWKHIHEMLSIQIDGTNNCMAEFMPAFMECVNRK